VILDKWLAIGQWLLELVRSTIDSRQCSSLSQLRCTSVYGGKSEAEVTNNRRLRLTYCTIKANYRQTRSIVRPLCNSRASCMNQSFMPSSYETDWAHSAASWAHTGHYIYQVESTNCHTWDILSISIHLSAVWPTGTAPKLTRSSECGELIVTPSTATTRWGYLPAFTTMLHVCTRSRKTILTTTTMIRSLSSYLTPDLNKHSRFFPFLVTRWFLCWCPSASSTSMRRREI